MYLLETLEYNFARRTSEIVFLPEDVASSLGNKKKSQWLMVFFPKKS